MIEAKLALRNLKQDFIIYSLMIMSSAVFIALIVGFQSTIDSGSLGELLATETLSDTGRFFKMILLAIAAVQYIILIMFINSYYRILNKNRVRELALYKIIGYTRNSIRKIILVESILVFIIILPIAYIIAYLLNHLIIDFVNYYINIDVVLTAELSTKSFIYSNTVLLLILLFNSIKTYRNTVTIDLEQALMQSAIQKKINVAPKYYVFANLVIGLILIGLMSLLSLHVSYTLRFGIIVIAIIYAIGLFLIINAFAKGYRYLITEKYKRRGFNRLQVAESNFILNKSRVVTLSSIILIMMSIGALLLSQAITITLNKSISQADFLLYTYHYNIASHLEITTWSTDNNTNSYYNLSIFPLELADTIGIVDDPTPYEVEVSSQYAAENGISIDDQITLKTDNNIYEFTVTSVTNENATPATTFVPLEDLANESIYKSYSNLISKTEIIEDEIAAGNLNFAQITTNSYFNTNTGQSIEIMRLSEYNQYLQLFGQKPVNLADDQIIIDGNIKLPDNQYQVAKYSHQSLDAVVLSDSAVNNLLSTNNYNQVHSRIYLKAIDSENRQRISAELDNIDARGNGIINLADMRQETLGNTAFVLLIALYLAIIFIITNFTVITINCLSHAIENKQLYLKLEQMGISTKEKNQYLSKLIGTISIFPLVVGTISGIIATLFAINLVLINRGVNFSSGLLLILILGIYIIIYVIFINILKYVYRKIIY